jgi:integrase/recombinase XerD
METTGRHPACPSTEHVKRFALYYRDEEGNTPRVVDEKLTVLSRVYQYFQNEPSFPHPTDFNPFESAKNKIDLSGTNPKEPRPIPLDELRDVVKDLTHIRDRALVVAPLKLGVRASELCNIKLSEIHISNSEVQSHYPELGTHEALTDRPNAVYIPHDREGNKSERPRVIPVDDELRRTLLQYLLCRPDTGEPWLFLSKKQALKLDRRNVNDVWKKHFCERHDYGETDRYRGVSSHYGRHYFSTWWKVKKDTPRPLVKYMRGDLQSGGELRNSRDAIDSYIHAYYEDIEPLYRSEIFKLRI